MAPSAKSRKGKKAWRKNIDASEVETFLEEQTYQQRRGPAAGELQDEQLFFVDKSADVDGATAVAEGKRPAKRRREEIAARPLRSQQILAEAHKAKPVVLAPPLKKKPATAAAAAATAATGAVVVPAVAAGGSKRSGGKKGKAETHPLDLWADEDLTAVQQEASKKQQPQQQQQQQPQPQQQEEEVETHKMKKARRVAEERAAAAVVRAMGPTAKPLLRNKSPPPYEVPAPRIPAVAVDLPGCSFNPDHEQHQDALAVLVAAEMKKELRKELLPTAPEVEVDVEEGEGGRPLTELERLQVEVAEDSSEEAEEEEQGRRRAGGEGDDPNAIALEEGDAGESEGGEEEGGGGGEDAKGRRRSEKKTKKDRNREARRKAAEQAAEERRRLRSQRRELQSLREVEEQLRAEKEEKELRRQRVAALRQERAAVAPPRLGKLRFEPPAVQVLTSDEKSGSLRQVVPCAMLAADRFKSLQQRGLLEPRKPQPFKEKRRKVTYEKGARSERAEEASAAVRDMTRLNKKARKQVKAAEAAAAAGGDDWM
ncbi:hypothetical protein Agub_g13715 [Astrephomene gubernaculifera]|uniref:Ribosome biogenesis protein NOP53 n=1 Tax=Astrephomene gubernaculifera TaxID=47775 RepID=A0AAD3HSL7_9CHLO|nr:hypothetical protein Agub_g13715 [Astrephomene gubernaculifera]